MRLLEWIEQLFEAKAKTQINRILELPTLHQAVLDNNISEIRLCLHHGVDIDQQDLKNGRTALHYAAEVGNEELIEILLQHHADITVKDREGNIAGDLAKKAGHVCIHMLLAGNSKNLVDLTDKTKFISKKTVAVDLKDSITSNKNDPANDVLGMGDMKIIENDTE